MIFVLTAPASVGDGLEPGDEPKRADVVYAARELAKMTLSQKVAQMILVGLSPDSNERILSVTDPLANMLDRLEPGGVILYGASFATVEQVTALVSGLQQHARVPLLVATDHEGGIVNRLTERSNLPATRVPDAAAVGRSGDTRLARATGRVIGSELRALGITLCLGPVVDVRAPGMTTSRTYGSDPGLVGRMAAAVVSGIESTGTLAAAKHFPGLGGSGIDTHVGLPTVSDPASTIRLRDLAPFRDVIAVNPAAIMLAHVAVTALDPSGEPASLSRPIATDLLRGVLGYDGLVVTDALNMVSVTDRYSQRELAVRAVEAGADILLFPADPFAARNAVVDAVLAGSLPLTRIDASVRRILVAKYRAGLVSDAALIRPSAADAYAALGAKDHRRVVQDVLAAVNPGR